MRKVLKNHREVAHIWAQQNQSEGCAGNMFFERDTIYSYRYHYRAGRIHNVKGQRIALVRSDIYNVSTSKHLNEIVNAVNGLMPYFIVPNVSSLKSNVAYLDGLAYTSVKSPLKRIKVKSKEDIKWEFEHIHEAYKTASEYRKLLGYKPIWPKKSQLDAIESHFNKRLKCYKELNTPEAIAKKQAEAKVKAERKHAKLISDFREGKLVRFPHNALPYDLIRLGRDATVVKTSRGAYVDFNEAVMLLTAIVKDKVKNKQIGSYTYDHVTSLPDGDKVIKIGCHNILLSEAMTVLGTFIKR